MSKLKNQLLGAVLGLAAVPSAGAYTVLTDQHVDVASITYSGSAGLGARVHSDAGNFSPDSVLVYDGPEGTSSVTRPSGAQWNFLGVGAGQTLYYWPQTDIPGRIYAGFEAAAVPTGTFAAHLPDDPRISSSARWLEIQLVGVRFFDLEGNLADADFSLWTISGVNASPTVWMSTADGIDASDVFFLTEGGHAHANWGFTEAGYYQIDVRIAGVLASTGERVESAVTTFHLGVEHLPVAIPEPALVWLLVASALALGLRHAACRKFSNHNP